MLPLVVATTVPIVGCESNDEAYVAALRDAMAKADVTLADTVADSHNSGLNATRAGISVSQEVFTVRGNAADRMVRKRYALSGEAIGEDELGASSTVDCSHAVSAQEAIAVAEADQSGTATSIELETEDDDDDVPCTWEVQVLTADALMEVEVGPDGTVLETELSDEDGSGDDD